MILPLKNRAFLDTPQTFFTVISGSRAIFDKKYGTVDEKTIQKYFEKDGKKIIDTILSEIMPEDFWMITTVKRPDGMSYMLYILNKEDVLDNMGFDKVMEHFS